MPSTKDGRDVSLLCQRPASLDVNNSSRDKINPHDTRLLVRTGQQDNAGKRARISARASLSCRITRPTRMGLFRGRQNLKDLPPGGRSKFVGLWFTTNTTKLVSPLFWASSSDHTQTIDLSTLSGTIKMSRSHTSATRCDHG